MKYNKSRLGKQDAVRVKSRVRGDQTVSIKDRESVDYWIAVDRLHQATP